MFKWIRPAAIVLAAGLVASTGFAQQRHAAPHGSQASQHVRSAHNKTPRARAPQARRAHPGARLGRPLAHRRSGPVRHHARRQNRRMQSHYWQRNHRPSVRQQHKSRRPARHVRPHRRS